MHDLPHSTQLICHLVCIGTGERTISWVQPFHFEPYLNFLIGYSSRITAESTAARPLLRLVESSPTTLCLATLHMTLDREASSFFLLPLTSDALGIRGNRWTFLTANLNATEVS